MTVETRDIRLKRLRMRSMRRGIKEMDLILGSFSERRMADLSEDDLDLYDALLSENDQDLYAWVTGQTPPAPQFSQLVAVIAKHSMEM